MEAFFDRKRMKEVRIREAKRRFANEVMVDIEEGHALRRKMGEIRREKMMRPREFNEQVERVYL